MNNEPLRHLDDSRHVVSGLMHRLVQRKCPSTLEFNSTLHHTLSRLNETLDARITTLFLTGTLPVGLKNHFVAIPLDPLREPNLQKHYQAIADEWEQKPACIDDGCACGQALRVGERILISDATHVRLCHAQLLQRLEIVPHTLALIPIRATHGMRGCLICVNKDGSRSLPRSFTEKDATLLEDVAHYIGLLLEHCQNPNAGIDDVEQSRILARLFRLELHRVGPDTELNIPLLREFSPDHLRRYEVLPIKRIGARSIRAALSHPEDFQHSNEFEIATGQHIEEKLIAPRCEILAAIQRAFPPQSKILQVADILSRDLKTEEPERPITFAESDEHSAPIINLSRQIVEEAYDQRASDIHIEPFEDKLLIRYRVDGICREKFTLPKSIHRPLVARFKIMSELDIAEHRLPQDGRIVFKQFSTDHDLDLRVSIVPANHGESVVMRILDKKKSTLPLNKLGYSEYNLDIYRKMIQAPYGMILHCGPTGSGKSMTLYAALNEINSPEYKILTAEDPIEYTIPRIIQIQMKREIGLTFASTLRSFLRQDPDIILVGEIRDLETAEIAVEAALTGHLLFSTLHTNDAASTITRLVDIGIEPFLLSSTLLGICAQRLLRRLCKCKQSYAPSEEERALLSRTPLPMPETIFSAKGCPLCENSGYHGRTGIHELMMVSDALRASIAREDNDNVIKALAQKSGMRTLFQDALEKAVTGTTSMKEVLAATRPDE